MTTDHPLPQPVELPIDERASDLPLRTQLVRFVLTGGLSAIVDFGLLVILMHFGLGHTPAKALSFIEGRSTAELEAVAQARSAAAAGADDPRPEVPVS